MRNSFLATIALGAMLLAEGAFNRAEAVWVRMPPPRPVSVGVVGRRPGPRYVWTRGYYRWGGPRVRRGFVWVPGRWRRPPRAGAVWVSPRWRRSRGGYAFVSGRWR